MSSFVRTGAIVTLLLAAAALLLAGCGETVIDDAKTEAAIEENLQRSVKQKVSSVDCPSGVEVEAGKTFDCTVSLAGGRQETATLKILNSNADVEVTDLKPDK
jgi:NAD(P)H-hydrate repair Nnr-like enzyme with NAD(P)H-hydrate epimerase domain